MGGGGGPKVGAGRRTTRESHFSEINMSLSRVTAELLKNKIKNKTLPERSTGSRKTDRRSARSPATSAPSPRAGGDAPREAARRSGRPAGRRTKPRSASGGTGRPPPAARPPPAHGGAAWRPRPATARPPLRPARGGAHPRGFVRGRLRRNSQLRGFPGRLFQTRCRDSRSGGPHPDAVPSCVPRPTDTFLRGSGATSHTSTASLLSSVRTVTPSSVNSLKEII